jgi:hypothetical protein
MNSRSHDDCSLRLHGALRAVHAGALAVPKQGQSDVEVGGGWELAIRQHLTLARAKIATNARLHVIRCSRPTILELSITFIVLVLKSRCLNVLFLFDKRQTLTSRADRSDVIMAPALAIY